MSVKDEDLSEFSKKLENFVSKRKYSLKINDSQKIKQRKKLIVAQTFHGAGIVVPVVDDVGYRSIGESPGIVYFTFNAICGVAFP